MSQYLSSTTSMVIGALIGIILIATLIIVICTFSLEGRRKESTSPVRAQKQRPNEKPAQGGKPERPARTVKEKPVMVTTGKTGNPRGPGVFGLFGPKQNTGTPKPPGQRPAKPAEARKPEAGEAVRAIQKAERSPEKGPKSPKSGFFGKKIPVSTKEGNPKASSTQAAPTNMPRAEDHAQMAPTEPLKPVEEASAPQPAPVPEPVPGAFQPVAATPAPTTEAAISPPGAEKTDEENTDSIFNLFNDTSGEESEISKFASNFDDVSLDSLLGDSQGILERLSKD